MPAAKWRVFALMMLVLAGRTWAQDDNPLHLDVNGRPAKNIGTRSANPPQPNVPLPPATDPRLADILTELELEYQQNPNAARMPAWKNGPPESFLTAELRISLQRDDPRVLAGILEGLAIVAQTAKVRDDCLQMSIVEKALVDKRVQIASQRADAALTQAEKSTGEAQGPSDLDLTLKDLLAICPGVGNPVNGQENYLPLDKQKKIDSYVEFITKWREYLSQIGSGDLRAALGIIHGLIDPYPDRIYVVPRSELMSRAAALEVNIEAAQPKAGEQSDELSQGTRHLKALVAKPPVAFDEKAGKLGYQVSKLSDLDGLIAALNDLKTKPIFAADAGIIDRILIEPIRFNDAYHNYLKGIPVDIVGEMTQIDRNTLEPELRPLLGEMVTLVLPRYVGLPENVRPGAGEDLYAFLTRCENTLLAAGNFRVAARCRQAQDFLRYGDDEFGTGARQVELMTSGYQEEMAGRYAGGVTDYEDAVNTGSDIIPPEAIGARLTKLSTQHPQEFQQGINEYYERGYALHRQMLANGIPVGRYDFQPYVNPNRVNRAPKSISP